jgi:hypothetical protein
MSLGEKKNLFRHTCEAQGERRISLCQVPLVARNISAVQYVLSFTHGAAGCPSISSSETKRNGLIEMMHAEKLVGFMKNLSKYHALYVRTEIIHATRQRVWPGCPILDPPIQSNTWDV